MHVVKASCLALLFSGAVVNAIYSTPSTISTGTDSSLTLSSWEERTDPSEHLLRLRYELIRQVGNRAWYFAAARISNIILRTVNEELERYNYISANAHATTLNITTSVETITHIALTTASVAGATGVQQPRPARTPTIMHELHADRNSFDSHIVIGDELHDWMVGNQTTNVAFMMYDAGGSVDVPILAYTSDNDTLHFHIQYSPPATSNLDVFLVTK